MCSENLSTSAETILVVSFGFVAILWRVVWATVRRHNKSKMVCNAHTHSERLVYVKQILTRFLVVL